MQCCARVHDFCESFAVEVCFMDFDEEELFIDSAGKTSTNSSRLARALMRFHISSYNWRSSIKVLYFFLWF